MQYIWAIRMASTPQYPWPCGQHLARHGEGRRWHVRGQMLSISLGDQRGLSGNRGHLARKRSGSVHHRLRAPPRYSHRNRLDTAGYLLTMQPRQWIQEETTSSSLLGGALVAILLDSRHDGLFLTGATGKRVGPSGQRKALRRLRSIKAWNHKRCRI
jgi:hypothetical protein